MATETKKREPELTTIENNWHLKRLFSAEKEVLSSALDVSSVENRLSIERNIRDQQIRTELRSDLDAPRVLGNQIHVVMRDHDDSMDRLVSLAQQVVKNGMDVLGHLEDILDCQQEATKIEIDRLERRKSTRRSLQMLAGFVLLAIAGLAAFAILVGDAGIPIWISYTVLSVGMSVGSTLIYLAASRHYSALAQALWTVLPILLSAMLIAVVAGLLGLYTDQDGGLEIEPWVVESIVVGSILVPITVSVFGIGRGRNGPPLSPDASWMDSAISPGSATKDNMDRSISPNASVIQEISDLGRLAAKKSRKSVKLAGRWRLAHYATGIAVAAAAGLAGIIAGTPGQVVGVVGAVAAGVVTTLNPGQRSEEEQLIASGASSLAREARVLTRIDLQEQPLAERDREALEDVVERYDALIGVPERRTFWARHRQRSDSSDNDGGSLEGGGGPQAKVSG